LKGRKKKSEVRMEEYGGDKEYEEYRGAGNTTRHHPDATI
jgi:hypothetical protein